jgi:hypothetical protein
VLNANSLVNQYVDLSPDAKHLTKVPRDSIGPSHLYLGASVWINQNRFKWLPWHPAKLSTTMLNTDVLTGPMSGCLVAVYRVPNGELVVHVGTTVVADESDAVKGAWRELAADKLQLRGFNPLSNVDLTPQRNANEYHAPEIWGLVTTDVRLFSLTVYKQSNNNYRYRIAAVEPRNSLAEDQLKKWGEGG